MHKIARFFTRDPFAPMAAVVLVAVWVLLCYLLGYAEMLMAPLLAFLPSVSLMLPAYLCYSAVRAGRIPAFLCILGAALVGLQLGGPMVLCCVLLVLLLPVALVLVMQDQRRDFWQSVGWAVGTLFAAGIAVVLIAWMQVGGDLVLAMRNLLEQKLKASPHTDQYLYTCYQAGLLSLPEGMEPVRQLAGFYRFNPVARQQLMRSLLLLFETGMRYQLPTQLVSTAILSGTLCVVLPRWTQRRRMTDVEEAPMPSFSSWALPKRMGQVLAVTLLVIGAAMLMGSGSYFYGAFVTLWAGVRQVMLLQGASTVSYLMKRTGSMGRGGRMAVVLVLAVFFGGLLWVVGCLDQFLDIRKLRLPMERKDEGEDDE